MIKFNVNSIKEKFGVGFGTSGIRDKIEMLTDKVVYLYVLSFVDIVKKQNTGLKSIAIGGDLRSSTPRILKAVSKAILDSGLEVDYCGLLPTPSITYFGLVEKIPTIMVTGSHIPDDRNGIKFQMAEREIIKEEEVLITNNIVDFDDTLFDDNDLFLNYFDLPEINSRAVELYLSRYLDFFDNKILAGKKIGLWAHSAVGRDIYKTLLEHFGAKVEVIDYSTDRFIPVDTDAVVPEVIDNMKKWTEDFKLDFMMSTDGDGDRPLLTDEKGDIVRSELLPMLAAKYLGIEAVASTITACTVLEKTNWFDKIVRTKVGSPFIVEAMEKLSHEYKYVSGYELNGGFFLNNDIVKNGKIIRKLVTRDAVLPILSTLALASEQNKLVSQLVNELPQRFTYSQSVKEIPTQKSLDILANYKLYMSDIENVFGNVVSINELDGLRLTFENDDVVHFRPSKNAPEFRNYTDSSSFESAKILSDKANDLVLKWTAN